jgi:hypothetical protein
MSGQESRPAKRKEEVEAALEMAAPASSPARGRVGGGGESAVLLIRDGVSSPIPADPIESLEPFPSGVFH